MPFGLLPTLAADAWYHGKVTVVAAPARLPSFMDEVTAFATGPYGPAKAAFPKLDDAVVQRLSAILGISPTVLISWGLDVSASNTNGLLFLTTLLQDQGLALGAYDGRATAIDTGIAGSIDPNSGGNDPTMTAVGGVYTAMWNTYLNDELGYVSASPFTDLNDLTFRYWDFSHIDPTGAQKGKDVNGQVVLYTAGDLAATMALNPDLKVFSANGYYDSVTPFLQTALTLQRHAARERDREGQPDDPQLPVRAHGVPRWALAHGDEGRPVAVLHERHGPARCPHGGGEAPAVLPSLRQVSAVRGGSRAAAAGGAGRDLAGARPVPRLRLADRSRGRVARSPSSNSGAAG